jgi:hypothetical protein
VHAAALFPYNIRHATQGGGFICYRFIIDCCDNTVLFCDCIEACCSCSSWQSIVLSVIVQAAFRTIIRERQTYGYE